MLQVTDTLFINPDNFQAAEKLNDGRTRLYFTQNLTMDVERPIVEVVALIAEASATKALTDLTTPSYAEQAKEAEARLAAVNSQIDEAKANLAAAQQAEADANAAAQQAREAAAAEAEEREAAAAKAAADAEAEAAQAEAQRKAEAEAAAAEAQRQAEAEKPAE